MHSIMLTFIVAFVFLAGVLLIWSVIHLLAGKRLGFRKQGCKGPVPGEDGSPTCCRGDGSLCEEFSEKNRFTGIV